MLSCYLDEAGGKDDKFTVVAGFVSTATRWEQFEVDWRLMLASYGVPYSHMKEFSQSTGPFKKWRGAESIRRRFLADAASIIKQRVQGGVFCYMHHTIFDQVNKRVHLKDVLNSPYAAAGRACAAQANVLQKGIECVFEEGGPDTHGLLTAMSIPLTLPDPIFKPSRDRTDKKGFFRKGLAQLQAADFLAYELRKHHREFSRRSGRPVRRSFFALLGGPLLWNYTSLLDEGIIAKWCQLEEPLLIR